MTKNKLTNLNDHLFAQIERLSDEDLTEEQIEKEAKRGEAIVSLSDQILRMTALQVQAAKIAAANGVDPKAYLPVTGVATLGLPSPEEPKRLYEDMGE